MKISLLKPYRTRSGRPVRIFAVNSPDPDFPVVGAAKVAGRWSNESWRSDGTYAHSDGETPLDLIEITENPHELPN